MPTIVFIEPGGKRREVRAPVGLSLMEAARQQGIAGVLAECGGACACATCHIYVEAARLRQLAPPEEMEAGMLENVLERRENSRLGCQVPITGELDGLVVTVAQRQR